MVKVSLDTTLISFPERNRNKNRIYLHSKIAPLHSHTTIDPIIQIKKIKKEDHFTSIFFASEGAVFVISIRSTPSSSVASTLPGSTSAGSGILR